MIERLRHAVAAARARAIGFVLDRLESDVFRFALLTVLLTAAVDHFVGWKYTGVVVREVAANLQHRVLPWADPTGSDRPLRAAPQRVATLLIGDELFADKDGFQHRVPLPPERVHRLLDAVVQAVPPEARLVVDFDLAPRVGEEPAARRDLDDWLAAHAGRLLLVEPAWAARQVQTLLVQFGWARRLCGLGDGGAPAAGGGAVFVQATLVSRFGVVADAQPVDGARGPAWDIGRAVAAPRGPGGERRNPICARLRADPAPSSAPAASAEDPLMLTLRLAGELQQHGALRIAPQAADARGRPTQMLLRSEFLRARPDCRPASFDDVARLACLRDADVVVIGGAWSHGFGDVQDTFVGAADGAVVHAAWIASWLQPARPLNKALEVVLSVVVIQSLLHPLLRFAFAGMRRNSERYRQRATSGSPKAHLGLRVSAMMAYLALAVASVAATVFALILFDGLLRWTFDRTLPLDTMVLTLLIWSALEVYGIGQASTAAAPKVAAAPAVNAAWLAGLCLLGIATVAGAWWLAGWWPQAVPPCVAAVLVGAPIAAAAHAARRRPDGHDKAQNLPPEPLAQRIEAARARWRALRHSVARSLRPTRSPRPRGPKAWALRLADALGVLIWIGVWVYGLWVVSSAAVWGLIVGLPGA